MFASACPGIGDAPAGGAGGGAIGAVAMICLSFKLLRFDTVSSARAVEDRDALREKGQPWLTSDDAVDIRLLGRYGAVFAL